MNLKFKSTNKLTATVKFIDDTHAIYSDEVSPTHVNALQYLTAPTKTELWSQILIITKQNAQPTRFKPIIAVITPDDQIKIRELDPLPKQPRTDESLPL